MFQVEEHLDRPSQQVSSCVCCAERNGEIASVAKQLSRSGQGLTMQENRGREDGENSSRRRCCSQMECLSSCICLTNDGFTRSSSQTISIGSEDRQPKDKQVHCSSLSGAAPSHNVFCTFHVIILKSTPLVIVVAHTLCK